MAYRAWANEACPSCGTRQSDWLDDRDAWIANVDGCEGCSRLNELQEQVDPEQAKRRGLRVFLEPHALVLARAAEED